MYQETVYNNPVETAQEMVRILKRTKCDLIICLSHLGYNYKNEPNKICDLNLLRLQKILT
jgi:5'-nucleotidase